MKSMSNKQLQGFYLHEADLASACYERYSSLIARLTYGLHPMGYAGILLHAVHGVLLSYKFISSALER